MVTVVVVINFAISLGCLFVAWQIWKLRRSLAQISQNLSAFERNTHNVLYGAPEAILKGQSGTQSLRQRYRQLEPQIQVLRQVWAVLNFGQTLWARRSRLPRWSRATRKQRPRQG